MVNNEMLALVPILPDSYYIMQWLLIQTQYMMSSLTLGPKEAPATIQRIVNVAARINSENYIRLYYKHKSNKVRICCSVYDSCLLLGNSRFGCMA